MQVKVIQLINYSDKIYWNFIKFFTTKLMYTICFLKGIKIGHNVSFYGWMKIKRSNGSIIEFGENITFRSKITSNLIGINRPCIVSCLSSNSRIIIGEGSGFSGTTIGCFKEITIGKNVRCGANTIITDSDWHVDDPRVGSPLPVKIGNNVWLGVNSIVLKGVSIGDNTIIGAGSIVVSDIPSNVIAAGNPCKIIKNFK